MNPPTKDTIPGLLVRSIPRELVLGVEDALNAGAGRAYASAKGMDEGHLPHVVGQLRHFNMNEAFYRALAEGDAAPTAIQGNGLVTGRTGVFTLARFNIPEGFWINGRRSQTRRQMAFANKARAPRGRPWLCDQCQPPAEAVAFFVACFSGSLQVQPQAPTSIQIAVPDRHMRGWLFREPLELFAKRYDADQSSQVDLAMPKLKKNIGKKDVGGASS